MYMSSIILNISEGNLYSVDDNYGYLGKIGYEKILKLRANTSLGYSQYYRKLY